MRRTQVLPLATVSLLAAAALGGCAVDQNSGSSSTGSGAASGSVVIRPTHKPQDQGLCMCFNAAVVPGASTRM